MIDRPKLYRTPAVFYWAAYNYPIYSCCRPVYETNGQTLINMTINRVSLPFDGEILRSSFELFDRPFPFSPDYINKRQSIWFRSTLNHQIQNMRRTRQPNLLCCYSNFVSKIQLSKFRRTWNKSFIINTGNSSPARSKGNVKRCFLNAYSSHVILIANKVSVVVDILSVVFISSSWCKLFQHLNMTTNFYIVPI